MSYREFLTLLLALGPKLPGLFQCVLRVTDAVRDGWSILTDTEVLYGNAAAIAVDAELEALESQVLAEAADEHHTFAGPGDFLRSLFQFIQTNPALLQLVISMLTKK